MQASSLTPAYRSTSAILTAHGSAAATRIPMGCCASTCPKAPTSACTAPRRLQPWQPPSTPVPERRLHGKHLPRHLISCFGRPTNIMLRRPLESALFGSIALVADGLHMSTHAGALLLAALAYRYARRHTTDARFTFGTGK